MQKFLRIKPTTQPSVFASSFLQCLSKPAKPFSIQPVSSLGFCFKPVNSALMHTSSDFFKPCFIGCVPSNKSCLSTSRCGTNSVQRPWMALKKARRGNRLAWSYTSAATPVEGERVNENENESDDDDEKEGGREEKREVRRRNSGGEGMVGNPDLLTIPGVGPRNLRKLVDKGIGAVSELKQLYRDKFFGKPSLNMVEYLQSSVGIIHKNHAESITTFIKESVDEEVKEDGSNSRHQKKRITLCVEGNISVGKSTFLRRIAGETLELRDLVEIVPEPVDKWQNIGADHFNILDAFYAEPKRYAYTFQNYVFVTRVMQERDSSAGIEPLRLMERSVFSDRMVFVRAVHEAKWMSEMEISIYDSWFDPVVSCMPGLIPDGFIYLRATPDTCHKRMMLRKRSEEGGVSLDYLRDLHEKHESWFCPAESVKPGLLSVSKPPFNILHPEIRDRVYFLEGPHMHSSIQKVPALILDCDPDIDFNRDVEAKRHYARQVAEFFEFVKKGKEVQTPKPAEGVGKDGRPQLILPPNNGLCFPDSALQSFDFRRSMSLV